MATFVLIHGGYHGGWCWSPLVEVLQAQGHHAIAPDLPIDDATAGFDEYAAAVVQGIDDAAGGGASSGATVVVGHSLGGHIAPLVAAARPCDRLVFLCAVPGALGQPIGLESLSVITEELRTVRYFVDSAGRTMQTPDSFVRLFYEDLSPEQALDALRRLRPEGPRTKTEPWPLQRWPDVARTVLLAENDRVLRLDAALEAAKANTGEEAIVLPGGHSVMLTHPEELAAALVERVLPRGSLRPG